MTADGKLGRRDLLRLGGLSAVTLPVVTTVGIVAGDQLLRSEERYGGFTVRTRRKGDSPFVFKPTYTRYHSKNAMFSRLFWDLDLAQRVSKTKLAYELNDPGYSHVDSALTLGAGFVGQFAGTNAAITDRHEGLLALEPEFMNPPTYPVWSDRWDHTQETPEGVAKIVKRAARYYGASLVGIAPLDPRWIYSGYFDLMNGSESRIEITEVEAIELPPGQMAPRDAGRIILDELRRRTDDEIKDTVVSVLREGGEDSGLPGVPHETFCPRCSSPTCTGG